MKWLKTNGQAPMTEKCFEMAAGQGNLDMMKWLKENNCPWNKRGSEAALARGREILAWLKKNGMI